MHTQMYILIPWVFKERYKKKSKYSTNKALVTSEVLNFAGEEGWLDIS